MSSWCRGMFAGGLVCIVAAGVYGIGQVVDEGVAVVEQVWASGGVVCKETDSLAACRLPDGQVRVFATSKEGQRVDIYNALNGKFVCSHGKVGTKEGEFSYPNGIVVAEFVERKMRGKGERRVPVVLVVERDNHRVQAFHADDLSPAGFFGADVLKRPYGGAVSYRPEGVFLYVTDTDVPREQTVRVFRVGLEGGKTVRAELVRSFGEKQGVGAVLEAESIVVDDRHERVLLCDEHAQQRNVKVYTLEGRFTGLVFGGDEVEREPEGIAIVDTPKGGYVILTDQQKELSVWHVYDRCTYAHRGTFTGRPRVANTDGICIYPAGLPRFPQGALFAVHDDAEVRAYSLADISAVIAGEGAHSAPK